MRQDTELQSPEAAEPPPILLSPRELAEAIGVSESSIKRWVDGGQIRAARTAGGHRRIHLADAIRFVRETRSEVIKPEILGLHELSVSTSRSPDVDAACDQLFAYLLDGAGAEARGLLMSLYLSGGKIAEIIDGPLRLAMERIGEIWQHSPEGIFQEHRATDITIQALSQLRLMMRIEPDAPSALGGAPAGDPYLLPSLAAATILAAEGFAAVNLGANTPVSTLIAATDDIEPCLVWISVSVEAPADLSHNIQRLATELHQRGIPLLVGGQYAKTLELKTTSHLYVGSSMSELSALARGLMLGAGRTG